MKTSIVVAVRQGDVHYAKVNLKTGGCTHGNLIFDLITNTHVFVETRGYNYLVDIVRLDGVVFFLELSNPKVIQGVESLLSSRSGVQFKKELLVRENLEVYTTYDFKDTEFQNAMVDQHPELAV